MENTDEINVFDEDWDTLVVLNACRYDMFESTSRLDGSLSSYISPRYSLCHGQPATRTKPCSIGYPAS
jgi:hypothetical protein